MDADQNRGRGGAITEMENTRKEGQEPKAAPAPGHQPESVRIAARPQEASPKCLPALVLRNLLNK